MTRTERAWHWRLWLAVAFVLSAMALVIASNRPANAPRQASTSAQQEARP